MQQRDETVSNTSSNPCFTQYWSSACLAAASSREGWWRLVWPCSMAHW